MKLLGSEIRAPRQATQTTFWSRCPAQFTATAGNLYNLTVAGPMSQGRYLIRSHLPPGSAKAQYASDRGIPAATTLRQGVSRSAQSRALVDADAQSQQPAVTLPLRVPAVHHAVRQGGCGWMRESLSQAHAGVMISSVPRKLHHRWIIAASSNERMLRAPALRPSSARGSCPGRPGSAHSRCGGRLPSRQHRRGCLRAFHAQLERGEAAVQQYDASGCSSPRLRRARA